MITRINYSPNVINWVGRET